MQFNNSQQQKSTKDLENEVSGKGISLIPLFKSIEELAKAAAKIDNEKKVSIYSLKLKIHTTNFMTMKYLKLNLQELQKAKGWASTWKKDQYKVRELNDRLMMAERAFTDRDGLSGRPWYKHLVCFP